MLSEKGSLKETPPIKLLLTVFEQALTGILYIKSDDVLKVLYFSRGKLTWAISNSDEDKLENIFIQRKIVDADMLLKVKRESHVSESIGKLLVGKGLITLEELIESTKQQLNRIIVSILKVEYGGFQFVKDSPPERLLSLDLNVTDFIIKFILEEVQVSDIWKQIGSLQVEFVKNPDENKISKYKLSERQQQLLNSFNGESTLESILSRYTGGHRESLLKIIYFFLMSQLLIKKEFDLSDSPSYERENGHPFGNITPQGMPDGMPEGIGGDDDFSRASISRADNRDVPHSAPRVANTRLEDGYQPHIKEPASEDRFVFKEEDEPTFPGEFRLPPKPSEHTRTVELPEKPIETESLDTIAEIERPASRRRQEAVPFASMDEGKKKLTMMNVLFIALIPVILGFIFLYMAGVFNDNPLHDLPNKKKDDDIIHIEEPTADSSLKDDNSAAQQPDKNTPASSTVEDVTEKDASQSVTQPDTQPNSQPAASTEAKPDTRQPAPQKTAEQKKPEPVKEQKKGPIPGKSAMSYYNEGDMTTAATVWAQEMKRNGIRYSILLELDCVEKSVQDAYKQIQNKNNFFLLNKASRGRNCYLVMWGKFKDKTTAAGDIKNIPKYFWDQQNPPEVIDLSLYL